MSSPHGLKIIEDLWFPDADLILRAEDSIFRVYGGFLGARSSVFRDMISFPQPPTQIEGEMLNGRAVVRLHDSPTEATSFLRAVFDSSFFMPPPDPVEFEDIIGVLRLSHKYDVQYLFQRALSHLDVLYPTDPVKRVSHSLTHVQFLAVHWNHVTVDMISLRAACEVGATWMLPAMYYEIAPVRSFLDHAADYLQTSQIQTCLAAQSGLVRAHASSYRFLRSLPQVRCGSAACYAAVQEAYDVLEGWNERSLDMDPLGYSVFDDMDSELCLACSEFATAQFSAAQQALWENLPALFMLPNWDELKEMRRKAMEDAT
ncbi:BTB domain-containing protein [Favolaschia claudopus]|uniref:BTB domain-containing protein n=1 Tax=Favolaschia claudopus TaxID=2862362 RepID=A0AAW0AKI3_9AGAR